MNTIGQSPLAMDQHECVLCGLDAQEILVMNIKAEGDRSRPSILMGYFLCGECKTHRYNEAGEQFMITMMRDISAVNATIHTAEPETAFHVDGVMSEQVPRWSCE